MLTVTRFLWHRRRFELVKQHTEFILLWLFQELFSLSSPPSLPGLLPHSDRPSLSSTENDGAGDCVRGVFFGGLGTKTVLGALGTGIPLLQPTKQPRRCLTPDAKHSLRARQMLYLAKTSRILATVIPSSGDRAVKEYSLMSTKMKRPRQTVTYKVARGQYKVSQWHQWRH